MLSDNEVDVNLAALFIVDTWLHDLYALDSHMQNLLVFILEMGDQSLFAGLKSVTSQSEIW